MINKNSLFNLMGVIFFSLSQWAIVSVIGRLYGLEMLGNYSFALAMISPLYIFFGFQLRNFFNTTYDQSITNSEIFNTRLITSLFFFLLSLGVLQFIESPLQSRIFTILMVSKLFDYISEIIYSIWQKHGKLKYVGISLSLKSFLTIAIFIIVSLQTQDLIYSLYTIPLVSMIFLICDFALFTRIESIRLIKPNIIKILKMTFPLALSSLVISLNANIPRYTYQGLIDEVAVGAFTSIFFFYSMVMVLFNALIQSNLKEISELSLDDKVFWSFLKKTFLMISFSSLIFILLNNFFSDMIYPLIYGKKNSDYSNLMSHLDYLIPLGLIHSFFTYLIMAKNKYKQVLNISLASLFTHIILSYYFVSYYGLPGGFWGFSMALMISSLLNYLILIRSRDDHGR